ncbi:UNVERIFIED_CONTAM: hypothetical protein ABIC26_002742 [Paenibacillus sp. PvR008]
MKYLTLKNMEKATKMIADKGYEWNKANHIAINCFGESKRTGMSVEFFISKIEIITR